MSSKGQTISDRLNAAKYTIAGRSLARCICKATTEEIRQPKKKHIDVLIACTYETDIDMMQLANLLIERTTNSNWVVVYKALITVHHLMSFGSERFTQYLASSNYTFQPNGFQDKVITKGYNMSTYIRRYAKYINQKSLTYRTLAIDLCRKQRTKEKVLRTMAIERLLETLPAVQKQLDSLLDFDCSADDLNNSIIVGSFGLLFHDAIRLFASYNDGIINLFEKYFDLNKKMCREAFEAYKKFLNCTDKVCEFLKVAEAINLERGDIPDFKRAPSSLLDALEQHLISLETNRRDKPVVISATLTNATIPSFSANLDFEPSLSMTSKLFEVNSSQSKVSLDQSPSCEEGLEAITMINNSAIMDQIPDSVNSRNDSLSNINNNYHNTSSSRIKLADNQQSKAMITLPPPSQFVTQNRTKMISSDSLSNNNNNINVINNFNSLDKKPELSTQDSIWSSSKNNPKSIDELRESIVFGGPLNNDKNNNDNRNTDDQRDQNAIHLQSQQHKSSEALLNKGDTFDVKPPGYSDGCLLTPEFTIQTRFDPSIDLQTQQQLIQIQREQADIKRKQLQQLHGHRHLHHNSVLNDSSNGGAEFTASPTTGLPINNNNNNNNINTSHYQSSCNYGGSMVKTKLKSKPESIFEDLEKSMRKSLQEK